MSAQRQRAAAAYGGDRTVATLVEAHVLLVRRIAWHLKGSAGGDLEIDDLIQIGLMALVEAAQAHDPDAATEDNFPSYAKTRIRGAILDEMRRRAAMSRGALRRRRELLTARETLAKRLGRDASDAEMAAYMALDMADYMALCDEVAGVRYTSLDDVYSDHSTWFEADEDSPFDLAASAELRARLTGEIEGLPDREALVLQLYFVEELNLAEIGDILGVTQARVSQVKSAALKALRDRLAGA
ncbi:MAG: FliA/WhiG family RNA polymerase sigma factor [Pseudomonadota bacterium]